MPAFASGAASKMNQPSIKGSMVRLACLVVVTALAAPASAQPTVEGAVEVGANIDAIVADVFARVNVPQIEKIARGTVRRARRAIAIGPTVGAWGAYAPSPELSEQAVTFGLGLEVFKVPVLPTLGNFKAILEERIKAKIKERITTNAVPPREELDRMAAEIFEEAKAEILGERDVRGKTFERPRFTIGLEANRLFEAEAWLARARIGIGISRVTLAASAAVAFTDPDTTVFLGPELVVHALLSKSPRSPVIDVFVRGDFEVTDRETNSDHVTAGARFLLDVL